MAAAAPLSDREQRMLLEILKLEGEIANRKRDGHMETVLGANATEEETAELSYNQAYFTGFATAMSSSYRIVEQIINTPEGRRG